MSDGSQFTTGAAENPTLTIVALAIRQADFIAGELSRGIFDENATSHLGVWHLNAREKRTLFVFPFVLKSDGN